MRELSYPFDIDYIISNRKKIKKFLLDNKGLIEKRIAILGGSTTNDVKIFLELFLLDNGIKPVFYESAYNKYYEDAIFGNEELDNFNPDIIYIHTTMRNILSDINVIDTKEDIMQKLNDEYNRYVSMWEVLSNKFNGVIIQNNFEPPYYRLLGNKDVTSVNGLSNFIARLNLKFYEYAETHKNFYINDLNYVASCYGLDKWHNQFYWYMYKYAMDVKAIPYLSFNISRIIKSIYGKNKKALVLDLDNTLWGGIVGDYGPENITVGPEVSNGQVYYEFQEYLKKHKDLGIILNINSKNEYENAIKGLNNPGCVLKPDDFISIKANWEPKNINIKTMAEELNLGADSFVFVDDNPAEREIVYQYTKGIATPNILNPEDYIRVLDRNGYFEVTNFTEEDLKKTQMYKDNYKRTAMASAFDNYEDYLRSLKMTAEIKTFKEVYVERISELSNKSNQFNLTTKRYSVSDIENIMKDEQYIKLYGVLKDIFGDNGLITVVIGKIKEANLHIDLWIMSCRVLKRDMEYAMMDSLVSICKSKNINKIYGYYYRTEKNKMVENFYDKLGFALVKNEDDNTKEYVLEVDTYQNKNKVIEVEK